MPRNLIKKFWKTHGPYFITYSFQRIDNNMKLNTVIVKLIAQMMILNAQMQGWVKIEWENLYISRDY